MTIAFEAPVGPDALSAFVRRVPVPDDLALLAAFPANDNATNTVNFANIVKRNRTARYRSFDGRLHVSARDSGSSAQVDMIPLSDSRNMGEYERLKLEFARTGGTNQAILADAIYNDAEDLTGNVYRRLEQAWGDVLTDGKLTVTEISSGFEADFGVPSTSIVNSAKNWFSDATATPITELRSWRDVYGTAAGSAPGVIRTSQRVLRAVQSNAEVVGMVYGESGRTYVTLADLNGFLSADGLPTFAEPYDTLVDVDGVDTRVIPDDRVILTPADLSSLGRTEWGITATALELVDSNLAEMTFEDAGRIVGVVEKVGPPYREFTFVDAVAMPVLTDARKLFIGKIG